MFWKLFSLMCMVSFPFHICDFVAQLLNCMILWWMSCRVVLDGSHNGLVACVVMRPLGLNAVFRVICPVSNWWISWVCRAYSSGSVDENLYACVGRLTWYCGQALGWSCIRGCLLTVAIPVMQLNSSVRIYGFGSWNGNGSAGPEWGTSVLGALAPAVYLKWRCFYQVFSDSYWAFVWETL